MTTSDPGPTGDEAANLRQRLVGLVGSVLAPPEEADDRYSRVQALKGRVTVERHGLGARLSHWTQAFLMFVLMGTGYAIWTGSYGPLNVVPWDGYYLAFGLHMWAGILLMAFLFVLFPLYHVYVDGHRQLAELADIRVALRVGQAFVGLKSYIPGYHEARQTYDEEDGDWVAYHPMQKTFFWWVSILFGVLALTGFGMYREMRSDPAWWVDWLGFLDGWLNIVLLKQIHLLTFFLIVAMVAGHVYFALLPSNRETLKSMVFGEMDAYVLGGEDDDER
ncbi:cytochrome b/b6 domain-containing protein [Halohasta salina]|uniref:cytochrome b/b6 domain-containing protein n=1 Tax=Halohasta salina TaxID=2961621 RepID=UPI0020A38EA3|nr:cytochrome b/b6 domain-containing protein [Halohasta salina]